MAPTCKPAFPNPLDEHKGLVPHPQEIHSALGFAGHAACHGVPHDRVPYLLSIQQGDVSQAQVSVSLGGGFPQEHQVQAGMEQIKDTFQANFHNCQLLELHFDAVYSGGLQEELQERYGTEETKGLFVVTSTVVTGRLSPPEGMSPATTYDDVQWILADTGNGLITVLDWGRFLVDRR